MSEEKKDVLREADLQSAGLTGYRILLNSLTKLKRILRRLDKMTDKIKVKPFQRLFMRCQFRFESRIHWFHKGKYWLVLVAIAGPLLC